MVIVHILARVNPDFPISSLKVFTSLVPGKLQEKKNIEKTMNFYDYKGVTCLVMMQGFMLIARMDLLWEFHADMHG